MRLQPIENSSDDACFAHSSGGGGGSMAAQHHQASRDQLDQLDRPNHLDDVFGSAPASPTETAAHSISHPSDVPRLQTEHTTAGYREGITVAKESSVQAGFDEGFSLGAALGAQAGQLLGLVEGIADALKTHVAETADADDAAVASAQLLREARTDLSTDNIFRPEYWAPDGNWTYDVVAAGQDDGDDGEPGQQIVFFDVANAHPLIRKWRTIVDEQLRRWRIQTSLLETDTAARLDATAVTAEPLNSSVAAPRANQTLDW
ncbi:hypothetical protein E4U43_006248 [Claviceps pusilla]|uniref:Protein YAE1 n=1 Tax=Claviceps pusilla TaxID=123648 RepID=A0A9P7NG40_9HYPO|nr:hypothetical protein E4U43_006248 [Claviceps pusilla]